MKNTKIYIVVIFISIITTFAASYFISPNTAPNVAVKETAYERVLRTGVIRCGNYIWPPYFQMDPNTGKLVGFLKETNEIIFKLIDLDVEYIEVVPGSEVIDLKNGKVDAICGASPYVIRSVKFIDYSKPYVYVPIWPYVREGDDRFKTIEDLNNPDVKFATIDGDLSQSLTLFMFDKASQLTSTLLDPSLVVSNVATGKADVFISDAVTVGTYNDSNEKKVKPLFKEKPIAYYPLGFSVKMGEDKLLRMLNWGASMAVNINALDDAIQKYDKYNGFTKIEAPY